MNEFEVLKHILNTIRKIELSNRDPALAAKWRQIFKEHSQRVIIKGGREDGL